MLVTAPSQAVSVEILLPIVSSILPTRLDSMFVIRELTSSSTNGFRPVIAATLRSVGSFGDRFKIADLCTTCSELTNLVEAK